MDIGNTVKSQLDLARNVHDMRSLNKLKSAANKNDEGALREAAEQFEAIFVSMLLKSMRKAQEALADKDSPFNSQQVKFYRDMHDQQLSVDLASGGTLGLADIIVRQLGNESLIEGARGGRSDGDIASYNRQQSRAVESAVNSVVPSITGFKDSAFESPEAFVEQLFPIAETYAQTLGLDPKALVAQAAVETGWGRHMIHRADGENAHNLFGIKADKRWQGEKALVSTVEYEQGIPTPQKAPFRAYSSFDESMRDYVQFVSQSPRYQSAIENSQDPKQYFKALQQSGYATDPKYADKVMAVMNSEAIQSVKVEE